MSLLNSKGGVGAWVAWMCGFLGGIDQTLLWVPWAGWACKILAWVKKNAMGGVGLNFGVGGVGP